MRGLLASGRLAPSSAVAFQGGASAGRLLSLRGSPCLLHTTGLPVTMHTTIRPFMASRNPATSHVAATATNHLEEGKRLIERGLPFKALQEFNAALSIQSVSGSGDSLELAEIYHCIADTTFYMEKYSQTEKALKTVLNILRRHFGDDSVDVATCLQNTAELYQAQANSKTNPKSMQVVEPDLKKLKAALPLMKRALQVKESHFKTRKHDDVVDCVYGMGEILIQMGEFKKAVAYFEEALPWFKAHKDHSDQLLCMNNLQICYKELRLPKKEAKMKRAIETIESELVGRPSETPEPTMKDFEKHMRNAQPLRAKLDSSS